MVESREEKNKNIEEKIRKEEKRLKHISIGKKIFKIIFSITLVFILIFMYMHYIGTSGLTVREYKVSSKKLPGSFHGLKVVHFSNLNYKSTTKKKELKALVSKINEINPDLVLFTGDLISSNKDIDEKDIKDLIKYLNKINSKLGIYAIKGDDDYNKKYNKVINETNINVINNSYKVLYYNGNIPILITGTGSMLKKDNDLGSTFSYNEMDNLYTISLIHEPDIFKDIKNTYKSDLVVAGHSNNGQIRLPFIGGLVKFDGSNTYINPKYEFGSTNLFISGGLGTSKFEFRLFNHPSINFYRLVKETK